MKHYICVCLKSSRKIEIQVDTEDLARDTIDAVDGWLKTGEAVTYRFTTGGKAAYSFVIGEIECVYYAVLTDEVEQERKIEKEERARLLHSQVLYYENLNRGEAWKNNEGWRGDD